MPRVDTYGEQRVATQALPGARKQAAETFESQGGRIADAQAGFGATVARVGINLFSEQQRAERDRADAAAQLAILRGFNDADHYTLNDPDNGMLHKRGLAVMENRDQALEEWDKRVGELGAELKSDRVRQYYEEQKVRRRDKMRTSIDVHGSRELEKHEAKEAQSTLASLATTAIELANVEQAETLLPRIAQNMADGEAIIDRYAKSLGLSGPEQIAEAKKAYRSGIHIGIVERFLSTEDGETAAREYFEEVDDQITDPKKKSELLKAIDAGSLRKQSQTLADTILNTTDSLKEAENRVREITDARLRDAVQERVTRGVAMREKQERDEHEAMVLKGLNIAERTGDWRRIPPQDWEKFTVGERGAIQNYLEQKANGGVKTNPHVYAHLSTLALSPDPAMRKAFVQMVPAEWIDKLSPSDYQHFVDLQGKIRQGDVAAAEKLLVNVDVQNRMVNEALVAMGLDPTPPDQQTKKYDQFASERVANFRRAAREAVLRLEQQKGKPATDVEVQAIVDQLRTPTGTRQRSGGGWFGSAGDVPAFAFETPQAKAATINDIPAGERRRIEQAFVRQGQPITDAAVLGLFNELLARTRKDR